MAPLHFNSKLLALAYMIVLVQGCEENISYPTTGLTNEYCNYFPLRIVNFWKYSIDSIDLNGKAHRIGEMTMRVTDTARWGWKPKYKLLQTYSLSNFEPDSVWLRYDVRRLTSDQGDVWVRQPEPGADTVPKTYLSNVSRILRNQYSFQHYRFYRLGYPCTRVESLNTQTLSFVSSDDYFSAEVGLVHRYLILGYLTKPLSEQSHYQMNLINYKVVL